MKVSLKILAIFKRDEDLNAVKEHLSGGDFIPRISRVSTLEQFQAKLEDDIWDLILVSPDIPSLDPLEAFQILNQSELEIPFIVIASGFDEELAINLLKEGVSDYILKSRLIRLVPSVQMVISEANLKREKHRIQEQLEHIRRMFERFMTFIPGIVTIKNSKGEYQFVNNYALDTFGWREKDVLGKTDYDLWPAERAGFYSDIDSDILTSGKRKEFNEIIPHNGEEFTFLTNRFPIKRNEETDLIGNISLDITDRRKIERRLEDTRTELEDEQVKLEKKDIALGEVLSNIDDKRQDFKQQIFDNLEENIFPTLHKLRASLPEAQQKLVDMLQTDLRDLMSPFTGTLKNRFRALTPRELEICRMIKSGMTSKEIAETLTLAVNTIHKHREMIRKKLGLTNRDLNLNSYLKSSEFK